jgi:hypothetical protein
MDILALFNIGTNVMFSMGVIFVVIFAIFYMRHRLNDYDNKVNTMFQLVSKMANEIKYLKQYQHELPSIPEHGELPGVNSDDMKMIDMEEPQEGGEADDSSHDETVFEEYDGESSSDDDDKSYEDASDSDDDSDSEDEHEEPHLNVGNERIKEELSKVNAILEKELNQLKTTQEMNNTIQVALSNDVGDDGEDEEVNEPNEGEDETVAVAEHSSEDNAEATKNDVRVVEFDSTLEEKFSEVLVPNFKKFKYDELKGMVAKKGLAPEIHRLKKAELIVLLEDDFRRAHVEKAENETVESEGDEEAGQVVADIEADVEEDTTESQSVQ